MSDFLFTSESVSEGHPDKVADQISDAVLDAILTQDKYARVAAETLVNTGLVVMAGEITTNAVVDFQQVARDAIKRIGYDNTDYGIDYKGCAVLVAYDKQSPDIKQGVDKAHDDPLNQGAGDQGLMFGYACDETPVLMPQAIHLAHRLVERQSELRRDGRLPWLRPDAKSQVTIRYVNGKPIPGPGYIQQQEQAAPGQPIVLSGLHSDGKPFTYTLQPVCDNQGCHVGIGVAGIVTVQSAVTNGVQFPFMAIGGITQGIEALATGQIKGGLLGPDGLTGPIGIATITYQQVNQGWLNYIGLVAILSVALGFTNLLPVPALDGGRIVVALVEWVRRRPFDRKSELNFQRWGLVALLALAAVISFLDIQRIATGTFPGSH